MSTKMRMKLATPQAKQFLQILVFHSLQGNAFQQVRRAIPIPSGT
ncbi:MAG TPA: hypothetical protein VKX46_05035 [Ktedonobacteraceae bacterium]|nr:hypothetical protein [Ktedonobacteraceae bacterium]